MRNNRRSSLYIVIYWLCGVLCCSMASGRAYLVFRYDDYSPDLPGHRAENAVRGHIWQAEQQMDAVFASCGMPYVIGVLPSLTPKTMRDYGKEGDFVGSSICLSDDSEKTALLRQAIAAGRVQIAQHGFTHVNYGAVSGRYSEFVGRSFRQQLDDISAGRTILCQTLGLETVEVFIPPFNSWNGDTARALEQAGFTVLSGGFYDYDRAADGLVHIPFTVEPEELGALLDEPIPDEAVIVVMCHPYTFVPIPGFEAKYIGMAAFGELVGRIAGRPELEVLTFRQLQERTRLDSRRFRMVQGIVENRFRWGKILPQYKSESPPFGGYYLSISAYRSLATHWWLLTCAAVLIGAAAGFLGGRFLCGFMSGPAGLLLSGYAVFKMVHVQSQGFHVSIMVVVLLACGAGLMLAACIRTLTRMRNKTEMAETAVSQPRPSLRINAVSNWAVLGLNILTGLFLTPLIIYYLDDKGYGIWTLVCSFIGYYGLMNMGVSSAIHRFIARDSARGDTESLNRVASTALAVFLVTGLVAILLSVLLAGVLASFFHVADDSRQAFVHLVWLVGAASAVGFPVEVLGAIVLAREHYVALNVANVVRILIRVGVTVFLLKTGWGLVGVGLAPLAALLVFGVMTCGLYRRYAGDIRLSLTFADRGTLRKLITYGGLTTIITMASLLRTELDSVVIGRMIGLAEVGYYGIAALIIRYIMRLIVSMTGVLTPRFASLDGAAQHDKLQRLFLKSCRVTSLLTFFVCIQAYLFGERFIDLWVRNPDYAVAVPVLHLLLICWSAGLCQNSGVGLMFALNRHGAYAVLCLCEAAANVIISVLLAKRFGVVGVAVGTLIPMMAAGMIVQPILISRIAKMKLRRYAAAILPGMAIAAVSVGLIHVLNLPAILRTCSLLKAGAVVLGSVAVTGGLCLVCWKLLEKAERCRESV